MKLQGNRATLESTEVKALAMAYLAQRGLRICGDAVLTNEGQEFFVVKNRTLDLPNFTLTFVVEEIPTTGNEGGK